MRERNIEWAEVYDALTSPHVVRPIPEHTRPEVDDPDDCRMMQGERITVIADLRRRQVLTTYPTDGSPHLPYGEPYARMQATGQVDKLAAAAAALGASLPRGESTEDAAATARDPKSTSRATAKATIVADDSTAVRPPALPLYGAPESPARRSANARKPRQSKADKVLEQIHPSLRDTVLELCDGDLSRVVVHGPTDVHIR